MEYRQLGNSGLRVSVLSFGTATFGGSGDFFKAWGSTQEAEAKRLITLCVEAGVNLVDTSNVYSQGLAETILGKAIKDNRNKILISTKATFPMGNDPNGYGSSRFNLVASCEDSLKRLNVDHIDLYHMHGFDANTPVYETLKALDQLVTSGKVRYIACSNFSGWHLMKSLSTSEKYGWEKYIANQAYYSLLNRDFEWELMPLGIDQGVSTIVWSPLAAGKLSGKYRRNEPVPEGGRVAQGGSPVLGGPADEERLYRIVEVLEAIAEETGRTPSQISINWLLARPTVANVIIGARNEEQLVSNLQSTGWSLTLDQVKRLDAVSEMLPAYPYWHQRQFPMLNADPKLYTKFGADQG